MSVLTIEERRAEAAVVEAAAPTKAAPSAMKTPAKAVPGVDYPIGIRPTPAAPKHPAMGPPPTTGGMPAPPSDPPPAQPPTAAKSGSRSHGTVAAECQPYFALY